MYESKALLPDLRGVWAYFYYLLADGAALYE
jgi:hypothetical protein